MDCGSITHFAYGLRHCDNRKSRSTNMNICPRLQSNHITSILTIFTLRRFIIITNNKISMSPIYRLTTCHINSLSLYLLSTLSAHWTLDAWTLAASNDVDTQNMDIFVTEIFENHTNIYAYGTLTNATPWTLYAVVLSNRKKNLWRLHPHSNATCHVLYLLSNNDRNFRRRRHTPEKLCKRNKETLFPLQIGLNSRLWLVVCHERKIIMLSARINQLWIENLRELRET